MAPAVRDTDHLRELLGVPYTDEQLAAITAPPAPGVIVAGAGSGKTTVMAARVVWLAGRGEIAADRVLGLTFTNKAAAELADRVRRALEKAGLLGGDPAAFGTGLDPESDDEQPPGEPVIATYHAYADRLIKEHGLRLGVEPSARLLADASRYQIAARVVRRAAGPFERIHGQVADVADKLLELDGELSEHLVSPERLREFDENLVERAARHRTADGRVERGFADLVRAADAARGRIELSTLVEAYRELKRERDLIDFGDQMALGARLAEERPEVGRIEREKYGVVLLDEYQDTSVAQRRMLTGLFGPPDGRGHPVSAVGDPCQSIYGWRGASVANLDDFPEHFPAGDGRPAARYTLTENRRSGGRLLSYANELSAPLREIHGGVAALRPSREKASGGWTTCALLATHADEVSWLADQVVRHHHEHGADWSEIAVLVRKGTHIPPIYSELHARGVPVEVVGLSGLLTLPEVADLVATLHVIDEPIANTALVRLLAGPRWRIGPRDLALLGRRARELVAGETAGDADDLERAVAKADPSEVVSLSDAVADPGDALPFSAEARARFQAFATEVRTLRRMLGEPLLDLLHRVISVTGLDVEVAAAPERVEARCRETVGAFLSCAADWVAGAGELDGDTSLTAFRAYLRAAARHERGLDVDLPAAGDSVKVLTMHKAKGLEWDVVVVPHLSPERARPGGRWTTAEQVLPFPLRGDRDHLPRLGEAGRTADFKAFDEAGKAHAALEDLRLAYVTFTRPRARLVASGHWWGPSQRTKRGPAPELAALYEHCRDGNGTVDVWTDEDEAGESNPAVGPREEHWPVPLDPDALLRRRQAAEMVLDARRRLAAEQRPPEPALSAEELSLVESWDRDLDTLLDELTRERRREIALPASLSATQLMRLRADPSGFARDLIRPMPRPPAPRARLGTRFHAWVEARFGQQALFDPDDLPGAADDADSPAPDEDLTHLQEAFLRTPYADRAPYRLEQPFQLRLRDRVIRGRIDAVYRTRHDDGTYRYEVVDWKTNRALDADPFQLAIYRVAWAELSGVGVDAVDAVFLYVRDGRVVRPRALPTRADLEAVIAADR